jgi:competence protein ComEA
MKNIAKLTLALLTAATLFAAPAQAESSGVVNVNTATAEQLSLLPRVGPSLAGKILSHREESGQFKKVEDLLLVSGIGDKLFSLIEPFVRTSGETTLKTKIKAGSLAKSEGGGKAPKEKAAPKDGAKQDQGAKQDEEAEQPAAAGAAEGRR